MLPSSTLTKCFQKYTLQNGLKSAKDVYKRYKPICYDLCFHVLNYQKDIHPACIRSTSVNVGDQLRVLEEEKT